METIGTLTKFIETELAQELTTQGHVLTGRLKKSIRVEAEREVTAGNLLNIGMLTITGSFINYGAAVDQGVKASRIPFSPGSGKKKSKYIAGLVDFVRKRKLAIGAKKQLGVAFAIAFKHKKQGMPTRGSRRFSKNGKRRGFMSITLQRILPQIQDKVQNIFEGTVNAQIDNIILKQNKANK